MRYAGESRAAQRVYAAYFHAVRNDAPADEIERLRQAWIKAQAKSYQVRLPRPLRGY